MIIISKPIPRPVIKRFQEYLARLQLMRNAGRQWTNSRELANAIGMTMSTVRQDVSHLDFRGTAKCGYHIEGLQRVLTHTLRLVEPVAVVSVGGGELGRTVVTALNTKSHSPGFRLCGIFDVAPDLLGTGVGRNAVRHTEDLPEVVRANNVEIGIVATPAERAQAAVDLLVLAGIRGVLNLSTARVVVPEGVSILDASVTTALLELVCELRSPGKPHKWKDRRLERNFAGEKGEA